MRIWQVKYFTGRVVKAGCLTWYVGVSPALLFALNSIFECPPALCLLCRPLWLLRARNRFEAGEHVSYRSCTRGQYILYTPPHGQQHRWAHKRGCEPVLNRGLGMTSWHPLFPSCSHPPSLHWVNTKIGLKEGGSAGAFNCWSYQPEPKPWQFSDTPPVS